MLLAAHPHPLWNTMSGISWQILAPFGLDLSMTPLTYDMTLMSDPTKDSYYRRQAEFQWQRAGTWESVDWSRLSFHGVLIPAHLMLELVSYETNVEGHVHGICYQLRLQQPDVQAFRIRLNPPSPHDSQLGLGQTWFCP